MSDRPPFRAIDPEGVADGDYVVSVTGGKVDGLTLATAGGALTVQDENGNVSTSVTQIDFQGAGVAATSGTGEVVVTISGGGGGGSSNYPPGSADKPPTTPNAKDDEFDGTSSVTWTTSPTAPTAADVNTTRESHLRLHYLSGASYVGRYQAVPASYPYTITTKVSGTNQRANYNRGGGIILAPAAPTNTSAMTYHGPVFNNQTGTGGGLAYGPIGERILTKFDGTFTSQTGPFPFGAGPYYVRVKVNSATSVDTLLSTDGWGWVPWESGFNPGFTPGVMGLAIGAVTTGGVEAFFDFFRVA